MTVAILISVLAPLTQACFNPARDFGPRLVHAILYIAGVPMIRPLAWAVGMAGIVIVLLAVLGIIS